MSDTYHVHVIGEGLKRYRFIPVRNNEGGQIVGVFASVEDAIDACKELCDADGVERCAMEMNIEKIKRECER